MKKFFPFIIIIFIFGCTIPENIGMPSWYTNLEFYFMNESFNSEDLELEIENISISEDGVVTFEEQSDDSQDFGPIEIMHPDEKETSIPLSETTDLGVPNGMMDLDAFEMIPVTKSLEQFEEFEEITFHTGTMRVIVLNNTAVWAGNSEEGNPLKVDVINGFTDEVIETNEFHNNDIAPFGGTSFNEFDLEGKVMPNFFRLRFYGGSRGTDGNVFVDFDEEFDIQVELEGVTARAVTGARIPDQTLEHIVGDFDTDIPYPIIEGDFDLVGEITINLQFSSPIPANVEIGFFSEKGTTSVQLQHSTEDTIFIQIDSGITDVVLSSNEYNINDLLEIMPDSLRYDFIPTIGDTTQTYNLHMDNEVEMNIVVNGNVEMSTNDDWIWVVPTDEDEYVINSENTEDFDEDVYNAFSEGILTFSYLNTTGHKLGAHVLVSDDSLNVAEEILHFSNTDADKVQLFEIPELDITEPGIRKELEFTVEQGELDFFLADSIWVGMRFHVYSVGGDLLSGDVSLIGKVGATILVDKDTFGDGE
jgi:hypothetical protein